MIYLNDIKLSKIINSWVPENSKVIDFGCGDGNQLLYLEKSSKMLIIPKILQSNI